LADTGSPGIREFFITASREVPALMMGAARGAFCFSG
jgi:hypothetical protein